MKEYVEVDLENLPYVDVNDTKIPAISLINGRPVAINGGSLKVYDWAKQPNKPIYNKAEVGLGLVENISPYNLPISTATQTALDLLIPKTLMGVAEGVASLDKNGKVPLSQLDDSVMGGMSYQGSWNAATNTPDLTTVKPKGQYYLVGVAGTQFGKNWSLGDTIISNGTNWDQIESIQSVQSVNGKIGVVVVTKTDVGLGNVDNTSDSNKPISVATQTALDGKTSLSAFNTHVTDKANPHSVTKAQVGLGNVLNKEQLGKNETAYDSDRLGGIVAANYYHTGNANLPTVDWQGKNLNASGNVVAKSDVIAYSANSDVKLADSSTGAGYLYELGDVTITDPTGIQSIVWDPISNKWVNTNIVLMVNGRSGAVLLTKTDVGLGNVDNTSDAEKPVSTLQSTAIADAKRAGTNAQSSLTNHINDKTNPHVVTKLQVGLGNVLDKEQLGVNDTAADSSKLGGLLANRYYNDTNSNKPTVDWECNNLNAVGDVSVGDGLIGGRYRLVSDGTTTFLQMGTADQKMGAITGLNVTQLTSLLIESVKTKFTGSVGLNIDNPLDLLHVGGNGRFNGNVYAQQDVVAYSTQSDVFIGATSGANYLYELSDVDISNPTDGDILRYDGYNDKWQNIHSITISAGKYTGL